MRSCVSSVTLRTLALPGSGPQIRSPGRGAPASSGRQILAGFALCLLLALAVLAAMSSTGELPSPVLLLLTVLFVVLAYIVVAGKIYRYID